MAPTVASRGGPGQARRGHAHPSSSGGKTRPGVGVGKGRPGVAGKTVTGSVRHRYETPSYSFPFHDSDPLFTFDWDFHPSLKKKLKNGCSFAHLHQPFSFHVTFQLTSILQQNASR